MRTSLLRLVLLTSFGGDVPMLRNHGVDCDEEKGGLLLERGLARQLRQGETPEVVHDISTGAASAPKPEGEQSQKPAPKGKQGKPNPKPATDQQTTTPPVPGGTNWEDDDSNQSNSSTLPPNSAAQASDAVGSTAAAAVASQNTATVDANLDRPELKQPISALVTYGLSDEIVAALESNQFTTVGDVPTTYKKLTPLKDIGAVSAKKILAALKGFNEATNKGNDSEVAQTEATKV